MKIPFINSDSSKIKSLQSEVSKLSEQLDEVLESDVDVLNKMYEGNVENVSGQVSVVDEIYDKASLQKLFATETWFFIVVNTIAKSIASLPIKLEKEKIVKQNIVNPDGTATTISRRTWIDASAEPEMDLFECPNYIQVPMEFWMLIVIDLLATGDAYIYLHEAKANSSSLSEDRLRRAISRVRRTNVDSMIRLNPSLVTPVPAEPDDNCDNIIKSYNFIANGGSYEFEPEYIVHVKMPNPSDPLTGLAPIVAVMKKILLDRYTDEHMLRFYKQGARLGGVIETTKNLTKEQMMRLNSTFEAMFTGKRNHHKTLILPNGMKYNTIEQNPGETSLIEFMKVNKEPILSAYNVPPIKIGLLDGATFSNAMIQNKTYYIDTIQPIAKLIGQAFSMNEKLLSKSRKMRFGFDFEGIEALKEDLVAKSTSATNMMNSGMSVNEVREQVWGLGPKEGGDKVPAIEKMNAPAPGGFVGAGAQRGQEKTEVVNAQNDTATLSDVKPTSITFDERVSQIATVAMANGLELSLAIRQATAQAILEGFTPTTQDTSEDKGIIYQSPFSKDALSSFMKVAVGEGVQQMIEYRKLEAEAFFDRMAKFVINKLQRKAYRDGVSFKIKAKLPNQSDLKDFIKSESKKITTGMKIAAKHGYSVNIPSKTIAFPNEKAETILDKIATRNVTSVVDTALGQLKNIVTSSFTEQVSVGELASRIRDVFKDISKGKAETIARTETLTAVSVGQALKTSEFISLYPDEAKAMRRLWMSAQDSKVRDSHQHMDGTTVKVGQKFGNGLLYPRDPAGEASEVINCRCTFIDYLPQDQDSILSLVGEPSPLKSAESTKVTRREDETYDECVNRAIPILINEGKEPDQAAAIAYSMCKLPSK